MSATTQVKVLSPATIHVALDQGFHFLETSISAHAIGESVSNVPDARNSQVQSCEGY